MSRNAPPPLKGDRHEPQPRIHSHDCRNGGCAFAMAAMACNNAYADDITVDNTPFVSSKTRAEVQAEVMGRT